MNHALLLFPDQLVRSVASYSKDTVICLIEDPRYFRTFRYHKQKLVLQRASMQAFRERLLIKGFTVHYCDTVEYRTLASVCKSLQEIGITSASYFPVTNRTVATDLAQQAKRFAIELHELASPLFLYPKLPAKLPSESTAYALIRQERNILMDGARPRGGIWELKSPEKQRPPTIDQVPLPPDVEQNRYVEEAVQYVHEHFPKNPGHADGCLYPVNHADAEDWLEVFLEQRLGQYGDYVTAMHRDASLLYHSGISALLNSGLLTPQQVIDRITELSRACLIPLASVERFYRRLVGAREYARASYQASPEGDWTPTAVPRPLLTATTGMLPIDHLLQRVLATGYANESERKYLLGAFAILLELPRETTMSWLQAICIDSAVWAAQPAIQQLYENPKSVLLSSAKLCARTGYPAGEWTELWDALIERYLARSQGTGQLLRPFGRSRDEQVESYILACTGTRSQH